MSEKLEQKVAESLQAAGITPTTEFSVHASYFGRLGPA
jgi:hypothetical protein